MRQARYPDLLLVKVSSEMAAEIRDARVKTNARCPAMCAGCWSEHSPTRNGRMPRARDPDATGETRAERCEIASIAPRLLDIEAASRYLGGISAWTLRALIADGHLHPVRLPSVVRRGETGRRLLLDVRELDIAIELWKGK